MHTLLSLRSIATVFLHVLAVYALATILGLASRTFVAGFGPGLNSLGSMCQLNIYVGIGYIMPAGHSLTLRPKGAQKPSQ